MEKAQKLADQFINEMQNTTIEIHDGSRDNYDIFGCVDGFSREVSSKIYDIFKLLRHTSVSQIFKRYLAKVLLNAYNEFCSSEEIKFNKGAFNAFANGCRDKLLPIGAHKDFFDPFEKCTKVFLDIVSSVIEAYVKENKDEFTNKGKLSILCERVDDDLIKFEKDPMQRLEHWIDVTRDIRYSGNTKSIRKKYVKAIDESLKSIRECSLKRSNSCSDLEFFR